MNDTEPALGESKSSSVTAEDRHDECCDSSRADTPATSPAKSNDDDTDKCNRGDTDESGNAGEKPREIGGRKGPDPVRYGDWEKNGRCIDF